MTSQHASRDDFDRLMSRWLESDAPVGEPEYLLDNVIEGATAARQIPRWLLPERWLPVQLTMPLRFAPRLAPILLLIALFLAAIVAIAIVGSRSRLPDPFGPAANGRVAYLSNGQIYAANPDGSNPIPLTVGSRSAATPAWSRDGTKLAYKLLAADPSVEEPTLFGDLVVVNADGSNPITIHRDGKGMSPATWSPDGRWLAYSLLAGGVDQIFVAAADGSSPPTRVGDPATINWAPMFSPDGTRILYFVGEHGVAVMNRDGSEDRTLNTTAFTQIDSAQWHPDGHRVVVSAAADEGNDLWLFSLDGGPERHLRVPGRAEVGPSWSPDGNRLVYLTSTIGATFTLNVADADGSNERTVSRGYSHINPSWSPDGSRIAVVNDLGSVGSVDIVDPDGVAAPIRIESLPPAESVIADRSSPVMWQRIAP